MMRKTMPVIAMVLGYLLLTAKSCEPDTGPAQELSAENQRNLQMQEVEAAFTATYLTADRIRVFEESGRLKLNDLTDYLNLYAGKDIDTLFRQQARTAIGRLFHTEEALTGFFRSYSRELQGDISSLSGFTAYRERTGFESIHFGITNETVAMPLQPDPHGGYSGEIHYVMRISGIRAGDTVLISDKNARVKIIAARTSKPFGDDHTRLVWQVFLADVQL